MTFARCVRFRFKCCALSKARPVHMSGCYLELSDSDPRLTVYKSRPHVPLLIPNLPVCLHIAHFRLKTLTTIHLAGMYPHILQYLRNDVPDPSYRFGDFGTLTFTPAGWRPSIISSVKLLGAENTANPLAILPLRQSCTPARPTACAHRSQR